MKRKYITILLVAAILSLTACGTKQPVGEENTETVTDDNSEATSEEIEENIEDASAEDYEMVSYEKLTSTIVSLGEYKGLKAAKIVEEVTDEAVEDEIWALKKESTELVEVDRPAKMKDVVLIDYTGYVDGKTSDSLQGTEYSLELGSGSFVPGFEEQLVGAKANEDRKVELTFPEDYYEEVAGKDVTFDVHVQNVSAYDLEDWGDEFIKQNLGYENEENMTASIRAELEAEAEANADANFEYDLIVSLLDKSEFKIEEADVEACIDEMMTEYKTYAGMYGVELEVFLQNYVGVTEAKLREMYRETANFRVKMMLALHETAVKEGLEITDEECDAKLSELAEQYGYQDTATVEAIYSREIVKDQMLQEKAIDLIRENAVIL